MRVMASRVAPAVAVAFACTGLGGLGCAMSRTSTAPLAQSFVVSIVPTYETGGANGYGLPARFDFTLRLDTRPDGTVHAVIGAGGTFGEGTFVRDGSTLSLDAPLSIPSALSGSCGGGTISLETASLKLGGSSSTGDFTHIDGTVTGGVMGIAGDVGFDVGLTGPLTGTVDTVPPSLAITGATSGRNVMDGVYVKASEPLSPGLSASLEDMGGGAASIPLEANPASGNAIGAFVTPPGTVLPFGATLSVMVAPAVEDLAGLPSTDPPPTLSTMPDPGLLAEDGFEGPVHGALANGAAVVSSIGSAPAISSAYGLWLPPGSRFTSRLALAPGDTVVRMSAQVFGRGSYGFIFGHLRVGVAGAGWSDAPTLPVLDASTATATGDPTWAYAGEVSTVEIPLPAGAAGEAVLDLAVDQVSCGPLPPPSGLLVDDVRAE